MKNNVLAVIVTYNRLNDLKNCIASIKQQSVSCDILIVNNGSSDGTLEFLNDSTEVLVINQGNLGGAGGFYAGQKYAYENGYEWVWMMDDDGLADSDQLKQLLLYANKSKRQFLNALVMNILDRNRTSFGAMGGAEDNLESIQQFESIDGAHLFNGTFVHYDVLKKIGFVKKEMFIWGDEMEYAERARAHGIIPTTVTHAIHYHPKEKGKSVYPIPFIKKYSILKKPKNLAGFYYRNVGYVIKQYCHPSTPWCCKFVLFNVLYNLRKFDFRELHRFIYFYNKGTKGIFE